MTHIQQFLNVFGIDDKAKALLAFLSEDKNTTSIKEYLSQEYVFLAEFLKEGDCRVDIYKISNASENQIDACNDWMSSNKLWFRIINPSIRKKNEHLFEAFICYSQQDRPAFAVDFSSKLFSLTVKKENHV